MRPSSRAIVAAWIFVVANAVWVAAVLVDGMEMLYFVADVLCVGAAALILAGFMRSSPLLLGAGAIGSIVCQGPFYAFATGLQGVAAQVAYVGACVAFLVAAWAWRRGAPLAKGAVRVAGWLLLVTSVGWITDWSTLWNVWQLGNALAGVAGILFATAEDPRAAAALSAPTPAQP